MDVNKYATKKTIAQGLLDVALLTANASQLKYVLQVGEKHEFYSLMLSLISISIVLQVSEFNVFLVIILTDAEFGTRVFEIGFEFEIGQPPFGFLV